MLLPCGASLTDSGGACAGGLAGTFTPGPSGTTVQRMSVSGHMLFNGELRLSPVSWTCSRLEGMPGHGGRRLPDLQHRRPRLLRRGDRRHHAAPDARAGAAGFHRVFNAGCEPYITLLRACRPFSPASSKLTAAMACSKWLQASPRSTAAMEPACSTRSMLSSAD